MVLTDWPDAKKRLKKTTAGHLTEPYGPRDSISSLGRVTWLAQKKEEEKKEKQKRCL